MRTTANRCAAASAASSALRRCLIPALLALALGAGCKKDAPPAGEGAGEGAAETSQGAAETPRAVAETPQAPAAAPEAEAAGDDGPSAASRALGERFPAGRNCTVEAVQAAVQPHRDGVKACYREALLRDPAAAGALRMQIVVDARGRATTVEVAEDDIGDDALAACVTRALEGLDYAPSPEGRPCTVVYPFDLQASPEVRRQLEEGAR